MERLDRMEQMINTLQKNMDQLINITTHSQQQQMKLVKDIQALYPMRQNQSEDNRGDPYIVASANHSCCSAALFLANQSAAPLSQPQQQSESVSSRVQHSSSSHKPPLPLDPTSPKPPPEMRKKRSLPHQRASVQGTTDTKPKLSQSFFDDKNSPRRGSDRNRNSLDARYFSTNLSSSSCRPWSTLEESSGGGKYGKTHGNPLTSATEAAETTQGSHLFFDKG